MIDQPQGEKPALTVVIQSWWTPAVALIFLVVGLLGGYFGRPLMNKGLDTTGNVATVVTPDTSVQTTQSALPTATVDPTQVKQLMDSIISQTTNFQGDPNATVTIIEFSDYQ
jgi:protein-disulfide isomerase